MTANVESTKNAVPKSSTEREQTVAFEVLYKIKNFIQTLKAQGGAITKFDSAL